MLWSKIKELWEVDEDNKFSIYCYNLGKEEVFANLSIDFNTKIMVPKDRWNKCEAIGIAYEYFTFQDE